MTRCVLQRLYEYRLKVECENGRPTRRNLHLKSPLPPNHQQRISKHSSRSTLQPSCQDRHQGPTRSHISQCGRHEFSLSLRRICQLQRNEVRVGENSRKDGEGVDMGFTTHVCQSYCTFKPRYEARLKFIKPGGGNDWARSRTMYCGLSKPWRRRFELSFEG